MWTETVAAGKVFDKEADGLDWTVVTVYRVGGVGNGPEGEVTAIYVNGSGFSSSSFAYPISTRHYCIKIALSCTPPLDLIPRYCFSQHCGW